MNRNQQAYAGKPQFYAGQHTRTQADAGQGSYVDSAIVRAVLPAAYACIEELLQAADRKEPPPKELMLRCRRLLPRGYPHSFEATKQTSPAPAATGQDGAK